MKNLTLQIARNLLYMLLICVCFVSCTSNQTQKKNLKQNKVTKIASTIESIEKVDSVIVSDDLPENLFIYYVASYEINKEKVAFISFSDNYALSEHPDSLAIPSLEGKEEADAERLVLKSKYRKRFLREMNISENDSLFVYDYAANLLSTVQIKNLKLVANITAYEPEWPYSQFDYLIGFEINMKALKKSDDYFSTCLAYVGKKNPFVLGKMKALTWKKISTKNFPSIPMKKENKKEINRCTKGETYIYETDEMNYYIQEFSQENGQNALRLVVLKSSTKETLCDKLFHESEGSSLSPLNFGKKTDQKNQWTGKLFKNKAPVVLGFEYLSFGCPCITLLDTKEGEIVINCDNRH